MIGEHNPSYPSMWINFNKNIVQQFCIKTIQLLLQNSNEIISKVTRWNIFFQNSSIYMSFRRMMTLMFNKFVQVTTWLIDSKSTANIYIQEIGSRDWNGSNLKIFNGQRQGQWLYFFPSLRFCPTNFFW